MITRRAEISDARQLAEVHVRSMRATYPGLVPQSALDDLSVEDRAARKRQHLTEGKAQTFVAEVEGEVTGFAVLGNRIEPGGVRGPDGCCGTRWWSAHAVLGGQGCWWKWRPVTPAPVGSTRPWAAWLIIAH